MSRLTNDDFKLLVDFLRSYSLSDISSNDDFLKNLKAVHKGYFSLLVFSSELTLNQAIGIDSEVLNRVNETCSDIGASLLLLAHGMYKQANMSLRSSIENFSKSIAYPEFESVIADKSVFSVFEKTKSISLFSSLRLKNKYTDIISVYSSLCAYTHTSNASNMANISALNSIPKFDEDKCIEFINLSKQLLTCFLIIYTHLYRDRFFKFNLGNRDAVLHVLSPTERRRLMEAIV